MSQQFNRDTQGTEVAEMFPNRVKHKTFVLCGLTRNELAATTADALAHGDAGAIIFTGCSQAELQPVIDNLNRKHPKVKVIFITADPGHLASVHDAAETIKKLAVPIDGIIGFPTVMAVPWERTDDGIEAHFQRNYLCYFLFVNLLLDSLAPGARVVLVSTSVRQEAPAPKWEDVGFSNGKNYHPLDGYTQSMFANILFVKSFARRYLGRSIAAFSANPGNIKNNVQTYVSPEAVSSWLQRKKDVGEDLPLLLQQAPKSLAQGSATVLRGLLDPALEDQSGAFLDNNQVLPLPHLDFPAGEASALALWLHSEEMVGTLIP